MMQGENGRSGVRDLVSAWRGDILGLASALIAVPSHNPPGDELAVAEVAADHLRTLGLTETRIVEAKPRRASLVCTYDTGRPGPTLILNGHLDTKPAGDLKAWETDPYKAAIREGRLYGLGAVDMKGPIAAMTYGLVAAREAAADRLNGRVLLVLSADEEGPAMEGARYLVEEEGMRADAVVLGEPCGVLESWDTLPLISRGFCGVRFETRGTRLHNSVSDRFPIVNASLDAARLMAFLEERLQLTHAPDPLCPTGPTVTLGTTMGGGEGLAFVPGEAWFTVNIRSLPRMTRESVAADIDRAVAAFRAEHPQSRVSWDFVEGNLAWTTPTHISADLPIVRAAAQAMEAVLTKPAPFGCCPGSTDAIWWQGKAGIPTIPAFGPGVLTNCHTPNESLGVEELMQSTEIFALLVIGYLGSAPAGQ